MKREEAKAVLYEWQKSMVDHGVPIDTSKVQALRVAIKALQGDMYCPNCGVRLVPENEYLEPAQTHGRLIDADALYASIAMDTYLLTDRINSRDYGMFLVGIKQKIDEAPTVQADRPHGEWVEREDWNGDSYYDCSVCGESFVLCDGTPSMNLYHFCPNCGADNRGETKCIK